ncbi:hypothetical protein ElyMa_000172600 [Elysia marginata]|uniref:Uncharacterized protein n=1 Tax=Elysia marginata TaxID=1093978 RepID=A0AAV4EUH2_9GAST|nr:hypothetical protein ElyMa_000172600 [Elysia marginata]
MDPGMPKPGGNDRQVPSNAEDQVNDESKEDLSATSEELTPCSEETSSQSQNPFKVFKVKTSTGLKKLRGNLSPWRKSAVPLSVGGSKAAQTDKADQASSRSANVAQSKSLRHESQLSEQTNTSDGLTETFAVAQEPYCEAQPNCATTKQSNNLTLKAIQPVLAKENLGQTEHLLQYQGSAQSAFKHPQVPTSQTPETTSLYPPAVPPRRSKTQDRQQEVQCLQDIKPTGLINSSLLPPEVLLPQTVHFNPAQSNSSEKVSIARGVTEPSVVYFKKSIEVETGLKIENGGLDYPETNQTREEPYLSKDKLHNKGKNKGVVREERPQKERSPSSVLNNDCQDQQPPPVLSVHQMSTRVEPGVQMRVVDASVFTVQNDVTGGQVTPSSLYPHATLQSMKPDPAKEALKLTSPRRPVPNPAIISQSTALDHPNRPYFENTKTTPHAPGTVAQLNVSALDDIRPDHINGKLCQNQTSPHQTGFAPQRPAPKPPSVRSTIVQYPGPLKGYTDSLPSWDRTQPPPLPPPPPPRTVIPAVPPAVPPRYMYYDDTEPRPYMPTTEPIPHNSGGVSFLSSMREKWRARKTGSTSGGQLRSSAMPGLGGLVSSISWKTSLLSNSVRRQFSSLTTSSGSHDSPGSPVDTKKTNSAWVFQPSKLHSDESVSDKERGRVKDNVSEFLFGEDIYKICLVQMACCCCWPIGLASRILASTVFQDRRRPSEVFIHTMAEYQSWCALLLGISFYLFFFVFTLSLLAVRTGSV